MRYQPARQRRNWALTIIASIVAIGNVILLLLTIFNFDAIGAWSPFLLLGSCSGAGLAVLAIATNDPSWLLVDLIVSFF